MPQKNKTLEEPRNQIKIAKNVIVGSHEIKIRPHG
jgi:hypothetical protein